MELLFAYLAGMLTLINPCILPLLPIVLLSALNAGRLGPIALASGLSVSFVAAGVLITAFGSSVGLTQDMLASAGAVLMVIFGAILLTPAISGRFEVALAGVASGADRQMESFDSSGLRGQFVGGLLLGAVWSPCIGPTLGGAIALASQGQELGYATLIMTAFALGVSTLVVGLGLGARETLRKRTQALRGLAERSKPILGVAFVVIGLLLFFNFHHIVEAWFLDIIPIWLQDLSVAI